MKLKTHLAISAIILVTSPRTFAQSVQEQRNELQGHLKFFKEYTAKLQNTFRVDPERIKSLIKRFDEAKTDQERYSASVPLAMQAGFLSVVDANQNVQITPKEKQSLNAAGKLVQETSQRAQEFESKLTRQDVDQVTQSNPDSFYRQIGKILLTRSGQQCSAEEYELLRKGVGLEELWRGGQSVGPLLSTYDSSYGPEYAAKLIALLKSDPRYDSYRPLADTYYSSYRDMGKTLSKSLAADKAFRRKFYEEEIIKAGVSPSQVRAYAFNLGSISPPCLGKIDFQFVEYLKADLSLTKGQFLLEKVRAYVAKNRKAPEDLHELPLDPSDPVYGNVSDGWYNDFVLERKADSMTLLSYGHDGKKSADDIVIGTVSLK